MPYTCTMVGAKQVYPGPFMQPEHLAGLIQDEKVTMAAGVPTLWFGLFQHLRQKPYDTSSLRAMVVGGSAMPRGYIEAYEKELGINVVHAWGMTETTPLGTVSLLKSHMHDWPEDKRFEVRAKQGMPVTGVEMRVADEFGDILPWDGESMGEVQVRGPWIAKQYYRMPISPESFTDDGWFRTGDVATIDPEGYMFITDRTKDLIKSGGEWISSVELENTIMAHPKVIECAVIAAHHEKWQERPLAVVVPSAEAKDDITKEEILEFLEGKVAKWWLPDDVLFVDELPKTSVGKFNKLALRREYADYQLPTA
jgi:acyl-CoA synthetase (AMP-forming)/AMP-acid ligase II